MCIRDRIHPNWGTHKFDFARGEVRSFLVSNVLYWLENFHVDGIRMDGEMCIRDRGNVGVASAAYGRLKGEDTPCRQQRRPWPTWGSTSGLSLIHIS